MFTSPLDPVPSPAISNAMTDENKSPQENTQNIPSSTESASSSDQPSATASTGLPTESDRSRRAFMLELQRTFARLVLSKEKWVDPTVLLKEIIKENAAIQAGRQEDVNEFDQVFLEKVEDCFASSEEHKDLLKNLFSGSKSTITLAQEANGEPFESITKGTFSTLILPVIPP